MHQSIATIDSPEFINLQQLDINPLMSSCEIKVLYLGENRNHSFISKEVATEMAKTLRGAPIVGYYKDSKEDFADHGERIIFDDEGVKVDCLTVPYGFVAPDAKVWFQKFNDLDDFGNTIEREYLMTTGFLWTGQFEEAKLAVEGNGRPHSMELDEKTLEGNWSTNLKTGMDFFIINDAIFSKLCILGEDVEPCFEGSTVTAPKVSSSFSLIDDNFKNTLFNMMQDLKTALEGGQNMADVVENPVVEEISNVEDKFEKVETVENEETTEDTTFTENSVEEVEAPVAEEVPAAEVEAETEFVEKKEEDDEEEKKEEDSEETAPEEKKEEDEEKKEPTKHACDDSSVIEENNQFALLQEEYNTLKEKYDALVSECEELKTYKLNVEDAKKEDLINNFYLLNDAEKKEIMDNKSQYSLEDIEAKLSVIYTRKNMNCANTVEKTVDVTTYNLANDTSNTSDWVKEVLKTQEQMNY